MRIPKIYKHEPDPSIKRTTIEVNKLDVIDYEPDVDFDDDKSVSKYIRTVKSALRGSLEYKSLMSFLKQNMNMNQCFFLPRVKRDGRDSKVTIEMHHAALTAEDLVLITLRKRYGEGEDYDVQSICDELMREHYAGHVSLVPLSATIHSLVHEEDGSLFIPLHMCPFGNSSEFIEKYKEWVPKELLSKFTQYQLLSDAVKNIDEIIPDYLDRHYIYYKCKDGIEVPDMSKILEFVDIDKLED